MKDDLFQNSTRKYDIFFRSSEKKVFLEGAAPGHDISCIIWNDRIFFPKTRCIFLRQEASDDLSQEIHGNVIFSVWVLQIWCHALLPKKSRMALSRKNTPKGD